MAAVLDRFRSCNLASWTDLVRTSSYVTRCRSAFDDDQESARIYVDIRSPHSNNNKDIYSVFVLIHSDVLNHLIHHHSLSYDTRYCVLNS